MSASISSSPRSGRQIWNDGSILFPTLSFQLPTQNRLRYGVVTDSPGYCISTNILWSTILLFVYFLDAENKLLNASVQELIDRNNPAKRSLWPVPIYIGPKACK